MRPGDLLEQRYRLVRVLGRGRSGSVWCARNELIDRSVAIKILHRSLAGDAERLQRFFQEARACGRVRHPAVVEVLDLGQGDDGILFLVMELLEGETLSSLLARRGRLQTDEALAIIIPLARGLAAAHAHGILHRDLKPANIYLHKTPTGGLQPKILDFGISKILGSELTQSGVVLGTPSYMSPEQARGVADLDPRMDVWSLGVILYECLTGRLPFLAREYRALVEEILDKKHIPVRDLATEVPPELTAIVDEALEKSRDRRLSSAASMAQKLTALLRSRGHADMIREPEDEFSDGAPTLARDRDSNGKPVIDDTVGDHAPLAAIKVVDEKPAPKRPIVGTPIQVQPSAQTAAIAAQTSGSKRLDSISVRPAAGSPARPSRPSEDKIRAERRTDPPPNKRLGTQSWEMAAAKAASGREEMSTAEPHPVSPEAAAYVGSGLPPSSSKIIVDEHWDTTVADISREAIEASGAAPERADGSLPKLVPGSVKVLAVKASTETPAASKTPSSLGAIPGFTTAPSQSSRRASSMSPAKTPTHAPPVNRTQTSRSSAPPPPPKKSSSQPPPRDGKSDRPALVTTKTKPPRPPPKTIPPGALSRNTLRPAGEGFGAAMGSPSATPPPPSVRPGPPPRAPSQRPMAPPADAPLIAPELFGLQNLGDEPIPLVADKRESSLDENARDAAPPSGERSSIPALGPPTNFEDTDRRAKSSMPIVPFLAAAVTVLFTFGAIVGTIAARSGGNDHVVRRFMDAEMVIIAWHDHDTKLAREEQTSAATAKAQADADAAVATAEAKLKADRDAAAAASAQAAASASASAPIATTTTTATATASAPPPPKPVWKPPPGYKPPNKTPSTTSKSKTSKSPSQPEAPAKKKKSTSSGEKEWWQKKF